MLWLPGHMASRTEQDSIAETLLRPPAVCHGRKPLCTVEWPPNLLGLPDPHSTDQGKRDLRTNIWEDNILFEQPSHTNCACVLSSLPRALRACRVFWGFLKNGPMPCCPLHPAAHHTLLLITPHHTPAHASSHIQLCAPMYHTLMGLLFWLCRPICDPGPCGLCAAPQ